MTVALQNANCQSSKETSTLIHDIDILLDSLLGGPDFEALSVGVIDKESKITFHKGKLLNGKTPSDETLYEIASLTKTFTGTLLAHAIEEGRVKIDDDIRKYLSDSFPNLEYKNQPITFRHLATHQSGLPNMFPNKIGLFDDPSWNELPFQINALQENFSREDFFRELSGVKLDTVPGLHFSYSNAGANLLGYILEEVYNQPFVELLKEKVCYPLKMSSTIISRSALDVNKLALGQNSDKIKMPIRADKAMNADGGIISSTKDMLKYLEFHLDETIETVSISHQHLWDGKFGDFESGLFWQINKNGENPDRIFQNGGAFGTSSWVTLIPEEGIAVFIVSNVSGPDIHRRLNETVEKIISEIEKHRLQ